MVFGMNFLNEDLHWFYLKRIFIDMCLNGGIDSKAAPSLAM